MKEYLEFEKPIAEIEEKIEALRTYSKLNPKTMEEIRKLEAKARELQQELLAKLTPWQQTQIARHPGRPTTLDYVGYLIQDFVELHGDRAFGDDHAVVAGLGTFQSRPVTIVGHQKGKTVRDRVFRNFGMPSPEGFRKALRVMDLAERFGKPVLSFIDTPGAYPGMGAEERGQAEAIAKNLMVMSRLPVPIIVVVIGEGQSGGALGLAVGDRLLMQEHAIFSVLSPEGCAAILWEDASKAPEAAEALKMTARDLKALGVIDEIIPEPLGGSHRDFERAAQAVGQAIQTNLASLQSVPIETLLESRYEKYRKMGVFGEGEKSQGGP